MKANKIVLLIAAIFLFINGKYLYAQGDYKIAEQDSLALVAFYNATDGPNWISNQDGFGLSSLTSEWQGTYSGGFNKWLEGPVKDWFGVTVEKLPIPNSSDSTYRVVTVWPVIGRRTDGENKLKGYIPREVGLLTALKDFRVNGNLGFTGTEIPDDLYHKSLQLLDIEAAWFDGEISDAFRNCTDIRKMNFRYNNIDYMPTLDFLDSEGLYNLNGTQWLYSTQLSLAIFEKTIDYFYTISENPKEFGLEMRDVNNVGDEIEIVAPVGSSVDMECTSAGEKEESISYQWYKNGLSRFGKTKRIYSIASVKESDYGDYKVKITNDYVKEYDGNSNWGEVYTKLIHLVPEPVAPVIEWAKTSYNGKTIKLRFSKPMNNQAAGYEGFTISAGNRTVQAIGAKTEGRLDKDLILRLSEPIMQGEEIVLSYSGNAVVDKNSGILQSISNLSIENMVRKEPTIVSANTTKDGNGIEVVFDNYIDANSINTGDFKINGNTEYTISSGTLKNGEIDSHISKVVLLSLNNRITDDSEQLTIDYIQGGLSGFLSGVVESFSSLNVTNNVILDVTEVSLTFKDGSGNIESALVQPSWSVNPMQLYDDGTHGDAVADDDVWTLTAALVDESYTWDVIARETQITYDTTSVTNPETGIITQTITPKEIHFDSVLSENVLLEFQVNNDLVTGTTSFGIMNMPVTFNLTLNESSDQVFLMGINDDWATGIPMERVGDSNVYTVILQGYTIGDEITYNYRVGDNWENVTAETRSKHVVAGENIINDSFGVFTNTTDLISKGDFKIYPNPAQDEVFVSINKPVESILIINLSGQIEKMIQTVNQQNIIPLQISHLKNGLYLVKLNFVGGGIQTKKLVKE